MLGAVVVSWRQRQGTFVASLANKNQSKADTLISVTGSEGIEPELVAPVEVEPGDLVNLADMGAVSVTGDGVEPGSFARLTLTFDSGQSPRSTPDRGQGRSLLRGQAGDPVRRPRHRPRPHQHPDAGSTVAP